jgi:hypothetical protein
MKFCKIALTLAVSSAILAGTASASWTNVSATVAVIPSNSIAVDEFGTMFVNNVLAPAGVIGTDPGPGGLTGVLIYTLPFLGFQGDVFLTEGPGGAIMDVLRFNGNGTVIFYSDNTGGIDSLADTTSPPSTFYSNSVTLIEIGPEGLAGADYTPTAGQPGYDPNSIATYRFQSDGTIPEPASMFLMASGFAGLAFLVRRRAQQ